MNKNQMVGAVMAQVVKRLRKSGLPADVVERAVEAAKGGQSEGAIELGPRVRARLLSLVRQVGPVVVTGRTHLKVFTLDGYRRACASSSTNAKAHKPWLMVGKAGRGKVSMPQDKPKHVHWTQKPENREKVVALQGKMVDARKAKKAAVPA